MTEIELNINKFAQNMLTDSAIFNWYDKLDISIQKDVQNKLAMFIQQSHPTDELIKNAIQMAPIKDTMTPVVLFKTKTLKNAINKIDKLPDSELRKSFTIMLWIFKIADTHRRDEICKNTCTHEWHNI
jgi:DNA-binding ferritin-like protein (Dps family)